MTRKNGPQKAQKENFIESRRDPSTSLRMTCEEDGYKQSGVLFNIYWVNY